MAAAVRRFGPVQGAGTVIQEMQPAEVIRTGSLGMVALVGQFERGTISTLASPAYNYCPSKATFGRLCGGRLSGLVAPDVAQDFFDAGKGAGGLLAVRLTDGNEDPAEVVLYSRHWGTEWNAALSDKDGQAQIRKPVLKLEAANGGAWGGRYKALAGEYAGGGLTETTLATDRAMKANEYAGATLTLFGAASYKVVSNDTAGVLTVAAGTTMLTDNAGEADKTWAAILDRTTTGGGARKGLTVKVVPAETVPADNFGLEVYVDGQRTLRYPTLSMDPASAYYAPTLINDDTSNVDVIATDMLPAGSLVTADERPAGHYGRATLVTADTVTYEAAQVAQVDSANVRVAAVLWPAGAAPVPHRLTLTWVLASNWYTVAAEALHGSSVYLDGLPDFAVGAGAQPGARYEPLNKHTVGLEIDHAGAVADGAKIVLDVLPVDLGSIVGGHLLPDAKTQPSKRFRIKSATYKSVTVEAGDLTAVGSGSAAAVVAGTSDAATYNVVGATSDGFKFNVDGRGSVSGTLTAGAARTPAQIAAEINAAFALAFGASSVLAAPASVTGTGKITITSPGGTANGGKDSTVQVEAVANDCYTLLGFAAAVTKGTSGTEAEVQARAEAVGGFDGGAPADSQYTDALAIGSSPLNGIAGKGYGVLQIACPGVTSTAVQKAGIAYGEAANHLFNLLIPSNTTDEAAAVDYVNDTIGRSDFLAAYFPSWGYVPDPDRAGASKLIPLTGILLGMDAAAARNAGGYHRPSAGVNAKLVRVTRLPTLDKVLDQEVLAPAGINPIIKRGGNFVVWGSRLASQSVAFQQKSHRLQLSHYEHVFAEAFDAVIFALNTPELWADLRSQFLVFFQGEYAKSAVVGKGLDDAASIKIDSENNTDATGAAGDLHAEVLVKLPNVVERFVITIGKLGIFETAA